MTEERKVEVSVLAERLEVSQVTIRKDLDELERRGIPQEALDSLRSKGAELTLAD